MLNPEKFEIFETRDGSLILSCGDTGMEDDLVFASGALRGDPAIESQREILEYIIKAVDLLQRTEKLEKI